MRSAAIYSSFRSRTNSPQKELLIYEQLEAAMSTIASLKRHVVYASDRDDASARQSLPGLEHIRANEAVVALGRAAHTVLADYSKRTLVAADLDLDGTGGERLCEDIEQFIWSCVNTSRIVALGTDAWQSMQLLPIHNRRFDDVPPLQMMPSRGPAERGGVLVINHNADETQARSIADALDQRGMRVELAGVDAEDPSATHNPWFDEAFFHVHVGEHTLSSDMPRLVDSWRSDRIALQIAAEPKARTSANPSALMIEVNGFICATAGEIVSVCREILDDRVLQRKLIEAGRDTVAPLLKCWLHIAEDLLAS